MSFYLWDIHYVYAGCNNDFVEVTEYDPATSTIACLFLDQPSMESVKSCHIELFNEKCREPLIASYREPLFTFYGNTTDSSVTLNLQLNGTHQVYCYIVTASNGTRTVIVEGKISK